MSDMKNRKVSASKRRARQRKLRNRRIAMTVALVLVVALASIGGTIAWLTATTATVTNTFTTAGIDISLYETLNPDGTAHKVDGVETPYTSGWTAQLVPSKTYFKDPKVTVDASTDVDIYLYVVYDGSAEQYLTFVNNLKAQGSGWTVMNLSTTTTTKKVYSRKVTTSEVGNDGVTYELIGGTGDSKNAVTVNSDINKSGMPTVDCTLTYTAYATQCEGFTTAEAAWNTNFFETTGIMATVPTTPGTGA